MPIFKPVDKLVLLKLLEHTNTKKWQYKKEKILSLSMVAGFEKSFCWKSLED